MQYKENEDEVLDAFKVRLKTKLISPVTTDHIYFNLLSYSFTLV